METVKRLGTTSLPIAPKKRPTLFYIDGGNNIKMDGWTMINPPNVFHSVKGNALNIAYSNLNMSAVSTSKNLPKNTDGK